MMTRVLLVGSGGAGKSTLAVRLAEATGLPLIHLDEHYWQPGWQTPAQAEWDARVRDLCAGPAWIIDGNYSGTLDARLAACDTVVLLDITPWRCLWQVCVRRWRYAGRSRPAMAAACPEKLDLPFLWWILRYRARRLPAVLAKLDAARRAGKTCIVLRNAREMDAFVAQQSRARV